MGTGEQPSGGSLHSFPHEPVVRATEGRLSNYSSGYQHRSEHTRTCAARIPVSGHGVDAPADRESRGNFLSGFEPPIRIALGGPLETRGTAIAGEDATSHECGQRRLWRGTEDMLCCTTTSCMPTQLAPTITLSTSATAAQRMRAARCWTARTWQRASLWRPSAI